MSDEREFDLGDILSITTDRLVSPRHIGGVYDILNFMTGDNLFTHQLPRASRECKGPLLEQLPALQSVLTPMEFEDEAHVFRWLDQQKRNYGERLAVRPLARGAHEFRDPIMEADQMMGTRPVVVVRVEND